jgi:hypothetical protein
MDGARQAFFADSGLAEDEKGAVSFHHSPREPEKSLHRGTRGGEVVELRAAASSRGRLTLRERYQGGAQDVVLETEPQDRGRARRDQRGSLVGDILPGEDHDGRGVGKGSERIRGLVSEEGLLQKQEVVVPVRKLLRGGRKAPGDLGLETGSREEYPDTVAELVVVDAYQDSDHRYRF